MPIVDLPRDLQARTGATAAIEVPGVTPREALDALAGRHPPLGELWAAGGERARLRLFREGRLLRRPEDLDAPLGPAERIVLVTAPHSLAGPASPPFSDDERQRYARHLALPEVGEEGQRRLRDSSVLIVGAGGLGSPLALYLAGAGIGRIGIADFDVVDLSNLQRQILHGTADVGRRKVDSARERIAGLNPHVDVVTYAEPLSPENAIEIIREHDIVADATDNYPARYRINDACVLTGRMDVYGSVFQFEGQVTVFGAPGGPCYRCLFPEPPPPGLLLTSAEGGLLGIVPGVIGLLQATEVVKALLGLPHLLAGRFVLYDAMRMRFEHLRVRPDPTCPCCGAEPAIDRVG
ncbi:MAG: molybdopterin-synthase adenylyltransferase MoeB [Candidatus Eisenbacteria bacterium]